MPVWSLRAVAAWRRALVTKAGGTSYHVRVTGFRWR